MIKKLIKRIFAVALLVPGLAYGQSTCPDGNPCTVSAPVVAAGSDPIPCDIGPPYNGSIPAAAAAAGFTHCAANYDFTQTQPFTNTIGGTQYTFQWSQMGGGSGASPWFSCTNSTSGVYLWYKDPSGVACDTTHQNITTDGGVQVLELTTLQSDNAFNQITTGYGASPQPNPFPAQYYYEGVFKPLAIPCTGTCLDISTTGVDRSSQGIYCTIGMDFDEVGPGTTVGGGLSGWNLNNCSVNSGTYWFGPGFPSPDRPASSTTAYQTYGALMMMDGVSNVEGCVYYSAGVVSGLPSGSFYGCTGETSPTTNPVAFQGQEYIYLGWPDSNPGTWSETATVYIQRVTMWTCPSPTGTPPECYTNPIP
jgi:hypothetical protein